LSSHSYIAKSTCPLITCIQKILQLHKTFLFKKATRTFDNWLYATYWGLFFFTIRALLITLTMSFTTNLDSALRLMYSLLPESVRNY